MPNQTTSTARTIVITGGTSGIGFACAAAIVGSHGGPWHVILPCRDPGRGKAAVDKLIGIASAAGTTHTVEAMSLDLASLASVRDFAAALAGRINSGEIPALQALVCNAGVQAGTTLTTTVDGFESTFGVNHLGHFLLVNELLAVLRPPSRVIVVASDTHDPANKIRIPDPAWNDTPALARGELGSAAASDKPFAAGQRRYTTSKLANIYFTYALARRLPAGVTANAFNPGLVPETGLTREASAPIRFAAGHIMPHIRPLLRRTIAPNVHTLKESGGSLAWLATAPEVADTTGKYFDQRQAVASSQESYDRARAEDLWTDSLALTIST
jgi:NAD(P)-dependent dehydrogenase (short-subunit alcohol dehydrogenase family)